MPVDRELLRAVRQALKSNNTLVFPSQQQQPCNYSSSQAGDEAQPPQPSALDASIPERGVSLAWLTSLADCLKRAGVPETVSTEHVVQQLLAPLCKYSVTASLDGPDSSLAGSPRVSPLTVRLSLQAATKSFTNKLREREPTQAVALKPREPSITLQRRENVSPRRQSSNSNLTFKQREMSSPFRVRETGSGSNLGAASAGGSRSSPLVSNSGRAPDDDEAEGDPYAQQDSGYRSAPCSSSNLTSSALTRRPTLRQYSLWELLPSASCGKPDHYVVHVWQSNFFDMVQQLSLRLNPPAIPNQPPPPPVNTAALFLWLDFAAVPQNEGLGRSLTVQTIHSAITQAKVSTLVVVDPELLVLNRTWTVMEMFATVYYQRPGKLEILFPVNFSIDMGWRLHQKLSSLDINNTEATKNDDKLCIVREIKSHVGAKRMAQSLQDSLLRVARSTLRWGNLRQLCTYLAMLLKGGEFALVGCVLSSIPQLVHDEKTLTEMREIFTIYDSDGSGELDIDEFIQVLDAAGFEEEEARRIFDEVNADCGDGVGFEEFEIWWVDSQRQNHAHTHKSRKDVSHAELCNLMQGFIDHLGRNELEDFQDYFHDWLDQIEEGTAVNPKQRLQLPPMHGDLVELADQISWKQHNEDHKGVAGLLYAFLQSNADTLDSNLAAVPRIGSSTAEQSEDDVVTEAIIQLLKLLAGLLRWYPSKKHHAQHFAHVLEQYQVKQASGQSPVMTDAMKRAKAKKLKMRQRDKKSIMYGVISNMVHLKYGQDRAMNTDFIKEAGTVLGRWMAANREGHGRGKSGGVLTLSQQYFGNSSASSGSSHSAPLLPLLSSSKGSSESCSPRSLSNVRLPAIMRMPAE